MELVDVQYLGASSGYQTYTSQDKNLISISAVNSIFGQPGDYIEYFIYDLNNEIIGRNYNATSYSPASNISTSTNTFSSIYLDPEADIRSQGFNRGSVTIKYNFFNQTLNSGPGREYWIKEISTSRTEIKVARQDLANVDLANAFDTFNGQLNNSNYYPDFYLNFGNDVEIIGVNAIYVEEDGVGYILFKLYEPLPAEYTLKSTLWVVLKKGESAKFQVTIETQAEEVVNQFALRGPNYNISLNQKAAQPTPYYNYDSLFSTTVTSSYQQLQSLFDEKAVTINTDYSKFEKFIHFSSATERINNFVYKLKLIESYQSETLALSNLPAGSNNSSIANSSRSVLQQKIDNIITKFDAYEHFLYFTSASTAWPKSTNKQPYALYSTTSSAALNWLGNENTEPTATSLSILYSASLYDSLNSDGLRYTTPSYIREDDSNQPYLVFLDMMGQHFDNIWIYYNDITNRFSAENNPNVGISLDLVGDALRGLGVQLYTNTNVSDNIYYSMLGINPDGSLLPPTGSEHITTYVTSSIATLPALTIEEEVYKRIYHNLPYLLKTKGTERGVRALIACYGIPNSILTVNEFGGYNMYSQGDIQGIQDNKIYTGSFSEISGSVLSPYTSIQYYQNNNERNSIDIEVGFSPADSINADITGSLPTLSVQQLIGNPNLQYSSSYDPLVRTSNTYFRSRYTSRYDVWDFIRIIKYYNNSLFKMLKDYVPARASLSSAIIIKSHILERNKYARHEPDATTSSFDNGYDGITMVTITGSDADVIKYPTDYTGSVMTVSGSVPVIYNHSVEKYTGEFGGSTIQAVSNYFPQTEPSYKSGQNSNSTFLKVGDRYEGGIIGYILRPSDPGYIEGYISGLIVTDDYYPLDRENPVPWGYPYTTIPVATLDQIGQGLINTNLIVQYDSTAGNAARLCLSFRGSGYSDWYLPTYTELKAIWDNGSNILPRNGIGAWVSVQSTTNPMEESYFLNTTNGNKGANYKGDQLFFYPVRSFSVAGIVNPQQIQLNPVYQNVLNSVKSQKYFDLDYSSNQSTPVNYGLITQSIQAGQGSLLDPYAPYAQLQDYNYSLRRSTQPRYIGSTLSGLKLNVYSVGDISYGLDPVINWNTNRIGLFTQAYTSSFIPGVTNISLGYLADVSGGLFELNQRNKYWQDVQNTFKAGTTLTVKQFDNKKYSKQQFTDGIKTIRSSGYSYSPLIYFASCSADPKIAFLSTAGSSAYQAKATNLPDNTTIVTGSGQTPTLVLSPINALKLFDRNIEGEEYLTRGSTTTHPVYTVQKAGTYAIKVGVNIKVDQPLTTTADLSYTSWSLQVWRVPSSGPAELLKEDARYLLAGAPTSNLIYQQGTAPCGRPSNNPTGLKITLSNPLAVSIHIVQFLHYTTDVCARDNGEALTGAVNAYIYAGNTTVTYSTNESNISNEICSGYINIGRRNPADPNTYSRISNYQYDSFSPATRFLPLVYWNNAPEGPANYVAATPSSQPGVLEVGSSLLRLPTFTPFCVNNQA